MNKKYFYKYAISKQQQIQKESNHLFQGVAMKSKLRLFIQMNICIYIIIIPVNILLFNVQYVFLP